MDFFYCGVCQGHFVKEKAEVQYPEEYFQEKYPQSFIARMAGPLLNLFINFRVRRIKRLLRNIKNPKILDYGCGSGKLIQALLKSEIETVGFEPSAGAVTLAKKQNLLVYREVKLVPGGYDLIMFWHSLEHTDNPLEVVRNIKQYLAPNGKLLIAVPNAASWEARLFKENWFHYFFPWHQIQFTPAAIRTMLDKSDLMAAKFYFFNIEYNVPGLVQSFLNLFLPENLLYSVVSHRRVSMSNMSKGKAVLLVAFILLLVALPMLPILGLFFALELILRKTGVMIIIAEKS